METHSKAPSRYVQKNHPDSQIISDKNARFRVRRKLPKTKNQAQIVMLSNIEPKNISEVSKDKHWIDATNEELDHIEKDKT